MRHPLVLLLLAALPYALPAPAAALEEPLAARSGGRSALFFPGASGVRVETGEKALVTVELPAGTLLKSAALVDSGWLLAGSRAVEAGGTELVLFAGAAGDARELAPPEPRAGRLRAEPLWLAAGGRGEGLLWLEGDSRRSLALRWARFDGAGFESPVTVSPPGPGSQLALAAAALPGGGFVAVWSAFDGEDDEILWSRFADGRWSAPRPLAAGNAVPDITPAVAALADGAIAAWNRFDPEIGAYRLVTARLAGEGWSDPIETGPAGALYPTFDLLDGTLFLLHLRAGEPRGWGFVRLDPAGRPAGGGAVESDRVARPVLAPSSGPGGVALRWADGELVPRWSMEP